MEIMKRTLTPTKYTRGGEETDLDKNLVEALADPLVHLVRNAVDHGVEIQRADLGSQRLHMRRAPGRMAQRGAGAGDAGIVLAWHEALAFARGQVDHDIRAGLADPVDHLAIEVEVHRSLGGVGVAHMHMRDGGAGPARLHGGLRDLGRGHGQVLVLRRHGSVSGHGAGHDGFFGQGSGPFLASRFDVVSKSSKFLLL